MSGRTVRPVGVELQEWLFRLCRRTALHWASMEGHTETAMALIKAGADVHGKDTNGYGFSGLHPLVGWFLTLRGGRSVLCRRTALHDASQEGHTETAMALAKAGADVRCKANGGYGSRHCILISFGLPQCRGGRSVHTAWSCRSACFGCAGGRRFT
jgi:hypothetical protein